MSYVEQLEAALRQAIFLLRSDASYERGFAYTVTFEQLLASHDVVKDTDEAVDLMRQLLKRLGD